MAYECYHCQHDVESIHSVTFYNQAEEFQELLCDECYTEWLHSLKG